MHLRCSRPASLITTVRRLKKLADAESAGVSTITALRREIAQIDDELARDHTGGFVGRRRKIMSWLRR
jgi:hypothetical protein